MSKVLKFFVHFIVICTIVCVLGLFLPPFFGVNTVVMDSTDKATTNLPLGSVTYAIPVKTSEIEMGTPILVQEDSQTHRYNVASLNLENGTGTVVDPSVTGKEPITVAVREYVPKVVITIGYVGYLLMATQSVEGMIILGLALLFLIILYVIAELWKKDSDEDEEDDLEDTPAGYVKSDKELRREEKIKARRMKEEEREIRQQSKQDKRDKKEQKRMIRTGGFVDEIEAEDEEEPEVKPAEMQNAAASEAHALLKKEIAAATAEEQAAATAEPVSVVSQETRNLSDAAEKPQQEPEQAVEQQEEAAKEPVVYRKLAMPVMTAEQLAAQAKAKGDAPHIEKDGITKVTLLDYSSIIAGEEE